MGKTPQIYASDFNFIASGNYTVLVTKGNQSTILYPKQVKHL